MKYTKPPLELEDQIKLLESRGLEIPDKNRALHYLSKISYYRLRAYMLPFQSPDDTEHKFRTGTSFDDILNLYIFDRELRFLIFDAIERIEIAIRTQIIYQYSIEYGFDFYCNKSLYHDETIFEQTLESLIQEIDRSHEIFLKHFRTKYFEEKYPPSIMALEVSSFGTLSKLFRNLKMCRAKKRVAQSFSVSPYILESWMQSTTYIRNIVAHHARLWNRKLTTRPTLLEFVPKDRVWLSSNDIPANKLYAFCACIMYLKKTINPGTSFGKRLTELVNRYPVVDVRQMGFPVNWKKEAIWQ